MDFTKNIFNYLIQRKKYWLTPLIIIIVLFSSLYFLAKNPSLAPFIYSNF